MPDMSVNWRVTGAPWVNSIEYVHSPVARMLTKRRAVDFCRVATAICMDGALASVISLPG